ncbi:MAG: hypothetical protein ACK53V_05145, partial [Planctomycetota bacterium]
MAFQHPFSELTCTSKEKTGSWEDFRPATRPRERITHAESGTDTETVSAYLVFGTLDKTRNTC